MCAPAWPQPACEKVRGSAFNVQRRALNPEPATRNPNFRLTLNPKFVQLRDDVADEGEDRSTRATLERLEATGSLDVHDYEELSGGYALLRSVDHQLRLIVGRSAHLPLPGQRAFGDIARRLGYVEATELTLDLAGRMADIRKTFERILRQEVDQNGA